MQMHNATTVCIISFIYGYFGDETRISKGDFAQGFAVCTFVQTKMHTFMMKST